MSNFVLVDSNGIPKFQTPVEGALYVFDRGFKVLPLRVNSKVAALKNFEEWAINAKRREIELFGLANPDSNWAVHCGASKLIVPDIDNKNNKSGSYHLQLLENKYGPLPETLTVRTPNAGYHHYFSGNCKSGNADLARKGIDIQSNGKYVLAPGSKINGKAYEIIKIANIPPCPNWLLELAQNKKRQAQSEASSKIQVGVRNNTLASYAGSLRSRGYEYEEILKALYLFNQEKFDEPLPEHEVASVAKSISNYPTGVGGSGIAGPYTDVWNGKYFYKNYGDMVRFCSSLKKWFVWDGSVWKRDETFRIEALAKKTLKKMREFGGENLNAKLIDHAMASEREPRLKAMIANLKSEPGITVTEDCFDQDSNLLNLQNGTLNLDTGQFRSHEKNDLITRKASINYNENAECHNWQKFLKCIFEGDPDLIKFMQKAIGYSLSGSIKEQCIFILYGTGKNGKSTFLKHIYRIISEYAADTPDGALTEKKWGGIPNDIARLRGVRFVTALETSKNKQLAESKIKQLTGDDPVTARYLYGEFFSFFPTCKIFMATNHKPEIIGTDDGIWRRIKLIPFNKYISADIHDPLLDEKLKNEYEGILLWAIKGYQLWLKEGLGNVSRVTKATSEYEIESDLIGNFLDERCRIDVSETVSVSDLANSIQQWTKNNGLRQINRNELNDYMNKQKFLKIRVTKGIDKGTLRWQGIGLINDWPSAPVAPQ